MRQQFGISRKCACQFIKTCLQCPQFLPVLHNGVNPWGLLPNQLCYSYFWFWKIKVYTCDLTDYQVAIALTREATKSVISHSLC